MNHKEIERWYRLRNIKRAAQVLVLVGTVFVISGYAVSRIFTDSAETFVSQAHDGPGMRTEKFSYSSPGVHPWELEAATAVISESLDRVILTKPRVVYSGGRGGKIFLTADMGDLDKKNSNVIARGNVTIRLENFVLTAGDINYSQDRKMAETGSPISLEGADFHLEGKGLKMSLQDEEVTIEQDVKARLFNVRWAEHSKVQM